MPDEVKEQLSHACIVPSLGNEEFYKCISQIQTVLFMGVPAFKALLNILYPHHRQRQVLGKCTVVTQLES